jgi:hypothetical protein
MTPRPPRRSTDVVDRRVAGETFLVPIRGSLAELKGLYALNTVGSFLWERIDGRTDAAGLARAVAEAFEVSAEVAAADTAELLATLRERGLIEGAS